PSSVMADPRASPPMPYTTLFRSSGAAPPKAESDYKLIRFFDLHTNPGKTYTCRVRVWLADPNAIDESASSDGLGSEGGAGGGLPDRKSTRLNSSHVKISYAVCCS